MSNPTIASLAPLSSRNRIPISSPTSSLVQYGEPEGDITKPPSSLMRSGETIRMSPSEGGDESPDLTLPSNSTSPYEGVPTASPQRSRLRSRSPRASAEIPPPIITTTSMLNSPSQLLSSRSPRRLSPRLSPKDDDFMGDESPPARSATPRSRRSPRGQDTFITGSDSDGDTSPIEIETKEKPSFLGTSQEQKIKYPGGEIDTDKSITDNVAYYMTTKNGALLGGVVNTTIGRYDPANEVSIYEQLKSEYRINTVVYITPTISLTIPLSDGMIHGVVKVTRSNRREITTSDFITFNTGVPVSASIRDYKYSLTKGVLYEIRVGNQSGKREWKVDIKKGYIKFKLLGDKKFVVTKYKDDVMTVKEKTPGHYAVKGKSKVAIPIDKDRDIVGIIKTVITPLQFRSIKITVYKDLEQFERFFDNFVAEYIKAYHY